MFRSALDVLDEAVCLCDQTGSVLYANPAAEGLMGRTENEVPGKSHQQVLCDLILTILESIPRDLRKTYCGNIGLAGIALEYSVTSLQENGNPGNFLITLKSPGAAVPEEECASMIRKRDIDAENDLRDRDWIMAGAALATNQLQISGEIGLALNQSLEILGYSANVDRAYIYEHYLEEGGEHQIRLRYEWARDTVQPRMCRPDLGFMSYSALPGWFETLSDGMPMRGKSRDQPMPARLLLEKLGVLSFLIVPIFTADRFWGFIGFDDRERERIWSWGEASILMTMASAIGGFIGRFEVEAALKESEEKYRELVETSSSVIMRVDPGGCIRFINNFGLRFFDYREKEILGRNVADTIFPDRSTSCNLRAIIENIMQHPEGYATYVMENVRSNGERVWIAWTYRPVQNERDEVVEVLCIGNDVTENKRSSEEIKKAAADLRETRDYLENLFGHANAPIIVWDPDFRITRFNHAFERLTGHLAGDVLGKSLDILFPDETRAESLAYIQRTLSGESWNAVEIPIRHESGEVRTVLWNSATIYDEDGRKVIATIAHGQDITERKVAEERVSFQASLLNQVRNAVIATDLEGRIIYWNRFSEVLYQWKAEEVLGRSIAKTIVPPEKSILMNEVMADIIRYGYRESEHIVQRKDGSLFPAFYAFSALSDEVGRLMGFVGVSIDLTERKKVEQDLRLAKERAESATKAKSAFLANMSHEIRTPMNAVIGFTGLLLNTNIDPEQRDCIETIRSSGDSLLAVISDILDFSKIEGGMLDLERESFDLRECLETSVNMVAEAAASKCLSLGFKIDPAVPGQLVGDLTRLRQILVNLLGNAVKFTETGSIHISVSSLGTSDKEYEIQFIVRDSGIGISRDRMSRLFQSFSQVDASTTRKYGGTGLGLAICKHLAELMGGRIWAESNPGKGSTFYFTIRAEASNEPSERRPEESPALPSTASDPERLVHLRILLAEDNVVNQKVALRMLGRLGYRADIAADGLEVLKALQSHHYDVVLMDVQMPEMDGLEATRSIRRMPGRQPYIIAMTAHAMKGDREECLGVGMNDYVSKPVRIEELNAALQRSCILDPDKVPK